VKKLSSLSCLICLLIPGSAALSQPFPSFMLDSSIARMPGFSSVYKTNIASGPEVGLVVWRTATQVRGARVGHNGVLLDSLPLDIDGPDLNDPVYLRPGVAWGGQGFLVVWANWGVTRCALVQADGQVTARAVLQDSVQTGQRNASVAFDGTNFLASWIAQHDTFGLTAFYSRVSQQGVVLDSPPRMVAPLGAGRQYDIALCFHEDRYLAAWGDWDTIGIKGNFIFPDGTMADSAGFAIRHGVGTDCPAVTHDRNNFIVSWNESGYRTRVARVTDGGLVLDAVGILIDSLSADQTAVVSNGDTTLILFRRDSIWADPDSTDLRAVRVDAAMNRLDAVPIRLSAAGYDGWGDCPYSPAAALCGQDYFIVWVQPLVLGEYAEDNAQALCRRMNRDGVLLDSAPAVLSYGVNEQAHPDVASDGENFLAVWTEIRRDSIARAYSVRAARFTADGTLLDSSPVKLGSTVRLQPAVAYGAGCYLVVWYDDGGISAKRVTPAGVVLDSVPLRMPEPGRSRYFPDVTFGDSSFLVVWPTMGYSATALQGTAPLPGIHGCRVTPAGAILDETPLLLVVDNTQAPDFPQVAFDGTNFLVARRDGDDRHRCVRVGTNGDVLDTADITLGPAGSFYAEAKPELTCGNGVYLAVDNVTGRCWRVSPSGYLLDSVPLSYSGYAHVVFDGADFMLLCQSRDTGGQSTNRLGAIRITPSGRVLDSIPFTLVTADSAAAGNRYAAMAINATNRVGAVFTGYERAPCMTGRIRAATFPAIVGIGAGHEDARVVPPYVLPNPASRLASLSFNLTQAGPVQVTAFDAAGRRCASLFSGRMKAGRQTFPLDTRRLADGVYFLRLEAEAATQSTRLVVAR